MAPSVCSLPDDAPSSHPVRCRMSQDGGVTWGTWRARSAATRAEWVAFGCAIDYGTHTSGSDDELLRMGD
jgi:hypothetical protein